MRQRQETREGDSLLICTVFCTRDHELGTRSLGLSCAWSVAPSRRSQRPHRPLHPCPQDQERLVATHTDNGLEFVSRTQMFMAARAILDQNYAKELRFVPPVLMRDRSNHYIL